MTYVAPTYKAKSFTCPTCGVYAEQVWFDIFIQTTGWMEEKTLKRCECRHCRKLSIWYSEKLIFPRTVTGDQPSADLPDDCRRVFEEARQVLAESPRASAALMRLCVQQLLPHLGETTTNLNDAIGGLVGRGMPVRIQQALDICRVIGNNAVHPGEINLDDTPVMANDLFRLVNIIVEDRITRPREIDAMYSALPEGARQAIAKRDGSPAGTE